MRRGTLLAVIILVGLCVSNPAHSLPLTASISPQQQPQPLKTYARTILPEIPEQAIKLDPPATELVVNIKTGDVVVPCGNRERVYTCVSGKPVKITAQPETPMKQLWVQNPFGQMIQLSINVYENAETRPPDPR